MVDRHFLLFIVCGLLFQLLERWQKREWCGNQKFGACCLKGDLYLEFKQKYSLQKSYNETGWSDRHIRSVVHVVKIACVTLLIYEDDCSKRINEAILGIYKTCHWVCLQIFLGEDEDDCCDIWYYSHSSTSFWERFWVLRGQILVSLGVILAYGIALKGHKQFQLNH